MLRTLAALTLLGAVAGGCSGSVVRRDDTSIGEPAGPAPAVVRDADAFAGIADRAARSRALFAEASRVLLHPRCVNCHPSSDSPTQGDAEELHDPPVQRGGDNHGIAGLRCVSCHQDHNLALARVPGAPKWGLAPRIMAWNGRSPQQLCEQLKDPARNGNRTLAQIVEHVGHDELVGWAWHPGWGRTPAPGTQVGCAALLAAWVDSGAECPEARP